MGINNLKYLLPKYTGLINDGPIDDGRRKHGQQRHKHDLVTHAKYVREDTHKKKVFFLVLGPLRI